MENQVRVNVSDKSMDLQYEISQGEFCWYGSVEIPWRSQRRGFKGACVRGVSAEDAEKKLMDFIRAECDRRGAVINRNREKRAKHAQESRDGASLVNVGDIFQYSFGYDMTINEYFQVIEVKGVTATVRKIKAHYASYDDRCDYGNVVATANEFCGEPEKKRIQVWEGQPYFAAFHGHTMRKWDGRPNYENHND